MSDKIQSILPPTASPAERAVDVTGGELLAQTPVHLVRDVKNADACPVALLPWLAWERSVDTWNDDWTEAEKRAAIKRAPYIHRHRGTKAALTASLTDSPFRSQIIEWFEQEPPGKPYTFRMNVEQKDLPVLMSDHQDLKHAVLRAKNLRSWFSIHVYGRETGLAYAAGYLAATEILRARVMPSQIVLTPSTLSLAPGDTVTVQVTVLPSIAEDKSFTVSVSDASVAAVSVEGTELRVTGRKTGACSLLVETVNGVRAELSIRVVAMAECVVRFDSADIALFFVDEQENDFTIDYGDGVDSRDYIRSGKRILTTRTFDAGTELTLRVKNSETISFFNASSYCNSLLEIILLSGTRTSMAQFAKNQATLRKIHPGAFDELPEVTTFSGAFSNCMALKGLPDNPFAKTLKVVSFREAFAYTGLQTLPPGMFAGLVRASDFFRVFYRCPLVALPEGVFAGTAGQNFEDAFYNCSKLTALPDRLFDMHLSDTQKVILKGTFRECTGLAVIPPELFSSVRPNINSLNATFYGCTALLSVPDRLCAGMVRCGDIRQMFYGCQGLESVGNEVFAGMVSLVTNAVSVFQGCIQLGVAGERLFADCTALKGVSSLFSGCTALKTLGGGLFAGNAALESGVTLFSGAGLDRLPDDSFAGCVGLKNISEMFSGFSRLTEIQAALFADCPVLHAERTFQGCASLRRVAPDFIRPGQSASSLLWMFHSCSSLEMDINDIFTQTFPPGCNLAYTFYNCKKVTGSKSAFLAKFPSPSSTANTFYGCSSLTV
ncbi:phage tail protein I [Salmonella enterica]|nr:phage tail protein I [Salmonella enterica]EJA4151048.1 phage tail protein I [Salmonella enterica]